MIWIVGGGDLAGQFYDRGLLDKLIIQVARVATGRGMPLLPSRKVQSHLSGWCRPRPMAGSLSSFDTRFRGNHSAKGVKSVRFVVLSGTPGRGWNPLRNNWAWG